MRCARVRPHSPLRRAAPYAQQAGGKKLGKGEGGITPRSEDFSAWYLDLIRVAELADYGPVRGTMVIRPYGYALWEGIQSFLDARFKETGHKNAYFPSFIPYSFIAKEADHVEGFAPELALVTQGGGKELEEPLVVRPTSETVVNHMFSQWVSSYRDLPLLVNQWANVVRWEMRTRPFVRTLEFLWQEGHTAHATQEEAEAETLQMLEVYRELAEGVLAMPVICGRKSRIEKFAGADHTYTIEAMMGDRKALQAGTSHNLGQNFAKAFGTQFQDEEGEQRHVWQTSWGVSTRMVGGLIMTHGDDAGLRLPPAIAPTQVVVIPIWQKEKQREAMVEAAERVTRDLKAAGVRVELDASDKERPGWKFNQYEMRGVPVRIELGPRDVEKEAVVVARRDRPGKEGKTFGVSWEADSLVAHVRGLFDDIQAQMLVDAKAFREENIEDVTSMEELKAAVGAGKWARCAWDGSDEQEKALKVREAEACCLPACLADSRALLQEETGATLRCFPLEQPEGGGKCVATGTEGAETAIFAKVRNGDLEHLQAGLSARK